MNKIGAVFIAGFLIFIGHLTVQSFSTHYQFCCSEQPSIIFGNRYQSLVLESNKQRNIAGAPSLQELENLNGIARMKLWDMQQNNYWAHKNESGINVAFDRLNALYDYSLAAENLSKGYNMPETVVAAWMASPAHKEALLNPEYQYVGFAEGEVVLNGKSEHVVIQLLTKK
jgi:uncharacterized protein YkwD